MIPTIRQAGGEWFIEVRGEAIGRADSFHEAEALANFWRGRLESLARGRGPCPGERPALPESLTRLLTGEKF